MTEAPSVPIFGIGNLLWAGESFGGRAPEWPRHHDEFTPSGRRIDGASQGIYPVPHRGVAENSVAFDAVDYGLPGGGLKRVEGAEVPRVLGANRRVYSRLGFSRGPV
jgi:hydrogenase maturation protease